jgi:hypothetical protein
MDDADEPEVEGVVPRPDHDFAFELKVLPRPLPNWVGGAGPLTSVIGTSVETLLILALSDRWGLKLIVLRRPTVWRRSVTSLQQVVVFEMWPDKESCDARARDVRRALEAGAYDDTTGLSRRERRQVMRTKPKG